MTDASTSLPAFTRRHVGPSDAEVAGMLELLGLSSLDQLVDRTIPAAIRLRRALDLPAAVSEREALKRLDAYASENEVWRSYLGYGYHDTITPGVILRNVVENPGWYTAYTPYQAEISQGRLEALLVFQTVVQQLCGFDIANASLLDEATAAAEAMTMSHRLYRGKAMTFFVSELCHPHTIAVVRTRAEPLGIEVVVGDHRSFDFDAKPVFGALVQYPATDGTIDDYEGFCARAHASGALVTMATDLLALTLLRAPGEIGADMAIGNSQRFGVPLGYGGPHAGFIATRSDHKRQLPGRIIGVSVDANGEPALRMALQTREQHIRRQKATSNICTAQVLLAVVAAMYAVYHGPEGLTAIARRVRGHALKLAAGLRRAGHQVTELPFFDTVRVDVGDRRDAILAAAAAERINLRVLDETTLCVALDETVTDADLADLLSVFGSPAEVSELADAVGELPEPHRRTSTFLHERVFHEHRSETTMLRYLHRLESRDLALNTSMIPLGSCTMKLNATTEMIPVTWRGFNGLHPFAPVEQARGYARLFGDLERWLAEITGFSAVSLQPNAGSQGEYAGLLAIREYHLARGDGGRTVCLIPTSAHGTNPASAVMAGMEVVPVACDDQGNIDLSDLRAKASKHAEKLGALMVTYPSTHGVFEEGIRDVCEIVHGHGGLVYLDGANMNAMVGLVRPGDIGADVCHLNLHKTFCIPHGGGGPGMGPIAVNDKLAPHLPGNPLGGENPVSAAPWGSASILPITWAYIAMLGAPGLTRATEVAILNANYVAKRLEGEYDVLYRGTNGFVAHECILDCRDFKDADVPVDDLAKRLIDFGFHSPTMSFPVAGTLMVEPTESEDRAELDRFCDALIAIRREIRDVQEGRVAHADSPLAHAPHTARVVTADEWNRAYSRTQAAWPAPWLRVHKYWPFVGRVDNAYGDRNLVCSCDAWPETE